MSIGWLFFVLQYHQTSLPAKCHDGKWYKWRPEPKTHWSQQVGNSDICSLILHLYTVGSAPWIWNSVRSKLEAVLILRILKEGILYHLGEYGVSLCVWYLQMPGKKAQMIQVEMSNSRIRLMSFFKNNSQLLILTLCLHCFDLNFFRHVRIAL